MQPKESSDFVVKKKLYSSPVLKEYGSFSEKTKGSGFQGQDADGQTYYGINQYS